MRYVTTSALADNHKARIYDLWNNEYPASIAFKKYEDFEKYIQGLKGQKHILLMEGKKIYGWYFEFDRNGERWFAMILDQCVQGRGYGSAMLRQGMKGNRSLSGWAVYSEGYKKSNGEQYRPPVDFYLKNGFEILHDIRYDTEVLKTVKIFWQKNN